MSDSRVAVQLNLREKSEALVRELRNRHERFEHGSTVRVVDEEHQLCGQTGVVARVCIGGLRPWGVMSDGMVMNVPEAWVRMDRPLPKNLRHFTDSRRNYIKLAADQCARCDAHGFPSP